MDLPCSCMSCLNGNHLMTHLCFSKAESNKLKQRWTSNVDPNIWLACKNPWCIMCSLLELQQETLAIAASLSWSDVMIWFCTGLILFSAFVHGCIHTMLMVDVSCIIHAHFTACWRVMMHALCVEHGLRKLSVVTTTVRAHLYPRLASVIASKWICLDLACSSDG